MHSCLSPDGLSVVTRGLCTWTDFEDITHGRGSLGKDDVSSKPMQDLLRTLQAEDRSKDFAVVNTIKLGLDLHQQLRIHMEPVQA
jgi:hypothetical protein